MFSVENILFYRGVMKFKGIHKTDKSGRLGKVIIETFLVRGSTLELNLSSAVKERFTGLVQSSLEIDVFDQALREVIGLLSDSFEGFKKSDMFRLYKGEIDPNQCDWIKSTGVSGFLEAQGNALESWI